jgi:transposase-like protein
MLPLLAAVLRWRKLLVGPSWRVDETYVLVGGRWKYLYRAVDKLGQTVDYLLTAHRDVAAARRFFERAIDLHDVPASITIDKSGANTAAVRGLVAVEIHKPCERGLPVTFRACAHAQCGASDALASSTAEAGFVFAASPLG